MTLEFPSTLAEALAASKGEHEQRMASIRAEIASLRQGREKRNQATRGEILSAREAVLAGTITSARHPDGRSYQDGASLRTRAARRTT